MNTFLSQQTGCSSHFCFQAVYICPPICYNLGSTISKIRKDPTAMNDATVFISYSTIDKAVTDRIREFLQQDGISCWMAPYSLSPGAVYAEEAAKAIAQCQVFLLILSKNSTKSQPVLRELNYAINNRKNVIPFLIEEVELSPVFQYYLCNRSFISGSQDFERACEFLRKLIRNILG